MLITALLSKGLLRGNVVMLESGSDEAGTGRPLII
jgi:hypothetical protein